MVTVFSECGFPYLMWTHSQHHNNFQLGRQWQNHGQLLSPCWNLDASLEHFRLLQYDIIMLNSHQELQSAKLLVSSFTQLYIHPCFLNQICEMYNLLNMFITCMDNTYINYFLGPIILYFYSHSNVCFITKKK